MTNPQRMIPLAEVTDKIGSGATPRGGKAVYRDVGVAFVRSQNVEMGRFVLDGIARLDEEAATQLDGVAVEPGDVLINITGESVGRTCRIPVEALPARVSQHVAIIRPRSNVIDADYLNYTLQAPQSQLRLEQLSQAGATRRALTKGHLERFEVPFPPLEEQRRIAGVLGALDDLADTCSNLASNLSDLADAVYRSRISGAEWVEAQQLGDWQMGQSPPGHTYNEDQEGVVFFQGVRDFGDRYPTPRVYCTEPTRVAETGSLLVAVRAPIGQVNLATQTTAIGRGLAALKAHQPSLALRALTAFPEVWQSHKGTGTVFESINRRDLLALRVPYIDDPELSMRLAALDEAHLGLTQEALLARATRDELLPLLLSGRVRVGEVAA